jgi:hypothetical protein
LTALNLHSGNLQCAPDVSSMLDRATLTTIKVSMVRLMHHPGEPGRKYRVMANGGLDMTSQVGKPGTAAVACRVRIGNRISPQVAAR